MGRVCDHINQDKNTTTTANGNASYLQLRGQQVTLPVLLLLVVKVAESSCGHDALALYRCIVRCAYHLRLKKKKKMLRKLYFFKNVEGKKFSRPYIYSSTPTLSFVIILECDGRSFRTFLDIVYLLCRFQYILDFIGLIY